MPTDVSLEQWRKDHEIPWDGEPRVEVIKWDLGDWRSLRPREFKLRVTWQSPTYNWDKIFEPHMERWQENYLRTLISYNQHRRLMMNSVEYRRENKRRMMAQLEVYRTVFQAQKEAAMDPRRSEHEPPLGFDTAGPDGSTFHYELARDEWDYPEWKRELYGTHPDPPRCMNVALNGDSHCENVATLRVIDKGEPTESVCCVPCSKAYPNFTYRQLRKETDADR